MLNVIIVVLGILFSVTMLLVATSLMSIANSLVALQDPDEDPDEGFTKQALQDQRFDSRV